MEPLRLDPPQPRRRVDVSVLIRDRLGRVLLVQPKHRSDMVLPGDGVHPKESVSEAAARALTDSMGMRRATMGALLLEQHPANLETGSAEALAVVLDGGLMVSADAAALSLPIRTEAVDAFEWVPLDALSRYVLPVIEHRIRAAYAVALRGIRLQLAYVGEPADQLRAA
ncbi:NUDIX hydrolase [Kitasatospora sp. NPDC047058]|uniref:NUDIX hydrolase n=1 Tax=Kitasatospora sp. NPDC047058 TaxID=3155620 RepID=UPI0033F7F17F